MAKVSKHAVARTKERLGLGKGVAEKNATKALENGLTHGDCTGSLKKYIDKIFFTAGKGNACNYRIYNHHIYCFTDSGKLVTVMDLPQNLCKLADKLKREKESKLPEKKELIETT